MLFVEISCIPSISSYKNLYDRVDQQQLLNDVDMLIYLPGLHAQSFKPALDTLTRVEIFIRRSSHFDPIGDIFIYIRDDLSGNNLASTWVSASSIPTTNFNWIEFNFDDILVTIDKTYYIVFNYGSNTIYWGHAYSDVYPRGEFWEYYGGYWQHYSEDFTFKTYGYNQSENPPPYKPSKPSGPDSGYCGVSYTYSTSTTDPNDDEVRYGWDWDGDGLVDEWSEFLDSIDSRQHSFSSAGKYSVHVKAEDPHGKQSEWSQVLEVTIENGTLIVNAGGPYEGLIEKTIQFNGEVTNGTEPYTWEWVFGDGTTAEIQNPIHTYENIGVYNIVLTVTDNEGRVGTDETTATIRVNNPPEKSIINGPNKGKTGTIMYYTFYSSDPDGDDLYYCVDWGDGAGEICLGLFPSNTYVNESHIWDEKGTYIIKAKAEDIYGLISPEATLEVTMPKNKVMNILLFLQRFFQRFPFFEKILNQ